MLERMSPLVGKRNFLALLRGMPIGQQHVVVCPRKRYARQQERQDAYEANETLHGILVHTKEGAKGAEDSEEMIPDGLRNRKSCARRNQRGGVRKSRVIAA